MMVAAAAVSVAMIVVSRANAGRNHVEERYQSSYRFNRASLVSGVSSRSSVGCDIMSSVRINAVIANPHQTYHRITI